MGKSTDHLDAYRERKRQASIEAVKEFLRTRGGAELTIADVAVGTGLSERTLRRSHILPLIEAATSRSFSEGRSGGDPRTVRSLRRKLDKALERTGRLEQRVADLRDTIAARDARIIEMQTVVDLLSQRARSEVETELRRKAPAQGDDAETPEPNPARGSAKGSPSSSPTKRRTPTR